MSAVNACQLAVKRRRIVVMYKEQVALAGDMMLVFIDALIVDVFSKY